MAARWGPSSLLTAYSRIHPAGPARWSADRVGPLLHDDASYPWARPLPTAVGLIMCQRADASAEMNSQDPRWPYGKVHILPVGRCTCAHSPSIAAASFTDALCISEVLTVRGATVSMFERGGVPMTGTT